jgi:hypothetical protein
MTKTDFNWDRSTWTVDFKGIFDKCKSAMLNSIAVNFPDYSKVFVLRTDASKVA